MDKTKSFLRLSLQAVLGALLLIPATLLCSVIYKFSENPGQDFESKFRFFYTGGLVDSILSIVISVSAVILWLKRAWILSAISRVSDLIEKEAEQQALMLDNLPLAKIPKWIFWASALSLFLELAVIRWESTSVQILTFYKNFGLLSCFAGLGIGYSISNSKGIPLLLTIPLLLIQTLLLKYIGQISGLSRSFWPFADQKAVLFVSSNMAIYAILAVVFILTALAFIPVGQLCGRLMSRFDSLKTYGLNLVGSLTGVVLMIAVSYFWTPPAVWFVIAFVWILCLLQPLPKTLLLNSLSGLLALMVLVWPLQFGYEEIYSPYQLLERGADENGQMLLKAAGLYFQHVNNLSKEAQAASPEARKTAAYYDLPYIVKPHPKKVAIVGAGSGNDVAAALRAGAEEVDAIEIDPAIVYLGRLYHPERPYDDPRVNCIIDDARAFFRSTNKKYDTIVFGLLDAHTFLSHGSNLRLDSYVYTVESFREARSHLEPNGMLSLAFCMALGHELPHKFERMLMQAFDGKRPTIFRTSDYDASMTFLEWNDKSSIVSKEATNELLTHNISLWQPELRTKADLSTDDWPFLYMPKVMLPLPYLFMVLLVAAVSAGLIFKLVSKAPEWEYFPFFLLGAGFMVIETKAITEMSLQFGSTWHVVGIVISAVLIMAWAANYFVEKLKPKRLFWTFLLLLASLGAGLYVSQNSHIVAGKWLAVLIVTCPVLFSGIVFSTLISRVKKLPSALAMNIFGSMVGGLLEYSAMSFGYHALYWLAIVVYGSAFVLVISRRDA